ncbi:hypothetical protein HELRODRAFT_173984 [Helobdella robusta]|uniref:Uncharacterized protein n=1 Tax=Helobdella robusta TaxID=6412 RepID=T1F7G1_HELRO|nr:hypothetical protein HELRODRAFT_173984 [Helobdella robusta]ESO03100.1 hypothetical protein HELRODRAFT_173984 [Helobdella robusta]
MIMICMMWMFISINSLLLHAESDSGHEFSISKRSFEVGQFKEGLCNFRRGDMVSSSSESELLAYFKLIFLLHETWEVDPSGRLFIRTAQKGQEADCKGHKDLRVTKNAETTHARLINHENVGLPCAFEPSQLQYQNSEHYNISPTKRFNNKE